MTIRMEIYLAEMRDECRNCAYDLPASHVWCEKVGVVVATAEALNFVWKRNI